MKTKKLIGLVLLIIWAFNSFALAKSSIDLRTISLTGLIVDANTLKPVEGAKLISSDGNLIGQTDEKGFFNVSFEYAVPGEIMFSYKIVKEGYKGILQKERWGDLQGIVKNTVFIGLSTKAKSNSFHSMSSQTASNYTDVLKIFETEIVLDVMLNNKIEALKRENKGSPVVCENTCYLVNNTGWIALGSIEDLISIDGKKVIPAHKLNFEINRKQIKRMTPLENGEEAKFAVYTR